MPGQLLLIDQSINQHIFISNLIIIKFYSAEIKRVKQVTIPPCYRTFTTWLNYVLQEHLKFEKDYNDIIIDYIALHNPSCSVVGVVSSYAH